MKAMEEVLIPVTMTSVVNAAMFAILVRLSSFGHGQPVPPHISCRPSVTLLRSMIAPESLYLPLFPFTSLLFFAFLPIVTWT